MKKFLLSLTSTLIFLQVLGGHVEKSYYFKNYSIKSINSYSSINFENTRLSGIPGEPMLPYHEVALMLPPGETAVSLKIILENEVIIPGNFIIYPQQNKQPISKGPSGDFIKNEDVYSFNGTYPETATGELLNQFLNGYGFALSTFTPARYNPASGQFSFFEKVTITVETQSNAKAQAATANLSNSAAVVNRVKSFAQNKEMIQEYAGIKSTASAYQMLIITPESFSEDFQPLIDMHNYEGLQTQLATIESISENISGADLQEKIRNYIINEYQTNGIEYVLLGGNPQFVPFRGFYCYVISGGGYEDDNIPADLYFSGLDGNYNANDNQLFGEVDDEVDLLPEVAVARFTFANSEELQNMVHKSVSYQSDPVLEDMRNPFLVSEHLYDEPVTEGYDYLELIIDDHYDNGYFTHGIPSSENNVERLYDSLNISTWNVNELLASINSGKQFIHHCGHSNSVYMMRMMDYQITNSNFYAINGIDHNYMLMYTHGCDCGAFDDPSCISKRAVSIDNFLVGGVFNSRYGWFDQGLTEGPSAHLHREFISSVYHDTIPEKHLGTAHMISKIKTAPWVTAPDEFEPGAQRWCHYDCNAFGDPALEIYTEDLTQSGIINPKIDLEIAVFPNPANNQFTVKLDQDAPNNPTHLCVYDMQGRKLLSQDLLSTSTEIQTDKLQTGCYFVTVTDNKSIVSLKLIIQ